MNTKQISPVTIRLEQEDKEALEQYAKKTQTTVSQLIREKIAPLINSVKKSKTERLLERLDKIHISDEEWLAFDKALKENRKQQLELQIKRDAKIQKMFED